MNNYHFEYSHTYCTARVIKQHQIGARLPLFVYKLLSKGLNRWLVEVLLIIDQNVVFSMQGVH